MHIWADVQSIIQLSVALNVAYTTLYSFIDTTLANVLKQHEYTHVQLEEPSIQDPAIHDKKMGARASLGKLYKVEREINSYNQKIMRPLAAAFSVIGLVLLIYSSAYAQTPIGYASGVLCCMLIFPFFFTMIVYCVFTVIIFGISARSKSNLGMDF
jgi:hypothetical protein